MVNDRPRILICYGMVTAFHNSVKEVLYMTGLNTKHGTGFGTSETPSVAEFLYETPLFNLNHLYH